MGMNYQYYVSMLKEFYGTAVQETFNNEVLLKKYLEQSSRMHDGYRYSFPVHTARNVGVGARAEGGLLPTAGQQSHASVYVTSAYVYGRINLTGQAMAASRKTAFAEALSNEMEGVKTDFVMQLGRMSYGDGMAILARVGASADTSTLYLVNQFNKPGDNGARYLNVGQKITVGHYSAAFGSACDISGVIVDSVTFAQNSGTTYDTVVVSGTVTTSGTGYVFSFLEIATTAISSRGLEVKGLRCIVDDTTQTCNYVITGGYFGNVSIFNVDRNAVKAWNATVDQNSGVERVLDSYLLQRTMSKIKKASGKDIDIMFGEYDTVDAFWDSVAGDRRFTSKNFDAGVETLTFNGKTMVKDLLAPYNELFLLHKPAIKWYVMEDLGFDDTDGSTLKNVSGYDKHEAFLKAYLQIAVGEEAAPNSCGVIRDIKTRL